MENPFVRKLQCGARLTDDDRALLRSVTTDYEEVPARRDLIREGDVPSDVHLVLQGLACRYKILPDGKRQIMALFLPGDICDLHVQILGWMDHSIGTLSPCRIVRLNYDTVTLLTANPRINRALWWNTLVDEGTLREWLVNMGQRSADRQIAHLFCELLFRLRLVGLAKDDRFPLPMTQEELGDATGLTAVHVNRMLRDLRNAGLVDVHDREVVIHDLEALIDYCDFNENYLHRRDPRVKRGTRQVALVG